MRFCFFKCSTEGKIQTEFFPTEYTRWKIIFTQVIHSIHKVIHNARGSEKNVLSDERIDPLLREAYNRIEQSIDKLSQKIMD